MKEDRMKHALENIAQHDVKDNIDLWPRIATDLEERKSFLQTLRARPALAIAIAILALLILTGAAYAIGRLTGYIPGVGLIDQSQPLRVLAEPLSQTRDGITLTVTSAVLTSDKTVVNFTIENVPLDAFSHQENLPGCTGMAEVHLPNGTSLQFSEGSGGVGQNRFVYSSIPPGVNDAAFLLPCILDTLPGKAPEDWELPLHFIPAPPDMTVVPVIEIAPTQTTEAVSIPTADNTLIITKALEVGDAYLLFGEFRSPQPQNNTWWNQTTNVKITDAKGQDILYTIPNDIELPPPTHPGSDIWVYKISKNFTPPLTISYPGIYITTVGQPQEFDFDFDAGHNPQPGQVWTLNKEFTLDGYTIQLSSISVDSQSGGGYNFYFNVPPSTDLFSEDANALSIESVNIDGYSPIGGGGGSGSVTQTYEKLPTGKLKIVVMIKHLASVSKKDWQIQWSPENPSVNASLYGIVLKLDKYIPLNDGYYLIGHVEWNDERITMASPWSWNMHAYDVSGNEIPIEPAGDTGLLLQPDQWIYHIYGKKFDGPITLRADRMNVVYRTSIQMTLDLRSINFNFSDDQLGLPFKTGLIPLDVPGIQANAFKVTYVKQGDQHGLEFAIQADSLLQALPLDIESGLDTTGLTNLSGGGGSNRDDVSGLVLSTVLTNAKITFPLVLSARNAGINGTWETTWDPPDGDPNAAPVLAPQACLTLDKWKQAANNPELVPTTLPDKVLISRGALSPDPSLFISTLDGKSEQGLVFGQGSLSPDGSNLVYSGADDQLYDMDIASGHLSPLTEGTFDTQPLWSPDGTRIAFTRLTAKGSNIFIMDAGGGNVRALTDTTKNQTAVDWMPDSKKLIVVPTQNGINTSPQLLDVAGGASQTITAVQRPSDIKLSISPDGQWIAFTDNVIGRMAPGIFISRLDGSEKRLLVQLDYWMVAFPVWSPDGKWLTFSVTNPDQFQTLTTPSLINVENCQVIPLTGLNGEIEQWINNP